MRPLISVIVPVYNVEKYLDRCVNSLLNQTIDNIEIILVDDGSPDLCPQMCDKYASIHSNIKVVHKQNAGLGMACNTGLNIAVGEYVAFVDSDDWVDNNMYKQMTDIASSHEADIVFSGLERNNGTMAIGTLPHPASIEIFSTKPEIGVLMKNMIASEPHIDIERPIQVSAKVALYRKSIIDTHEIRFESERSLISEDLLFNLDYLSHAGKVVIIPNCFYHYYTNQQSITCNTAKDKRADFEKFHNHIQKRYPQFMDDDDFMIRTDRLFAGYIRSYMDFIVNHTSITAKDKIKRINSLCHCSNWELIKTRYPVDSMPMKHKVILRLTLWKQAMLLFAIFKLYHR